MDTGAFLDALFGATEGYAAAPTLTGGQWELIDGKLKNPAGVWRERFFAWPADRDKLIEHVQRDADRDVYLCPYVRPEKSRKDVVVPEILQVVHGDADDGVEESVARDLGAALVASGQEGHFHVYVPLTEPVSPEQHRILEEGLRAKINGDNKIAHNDVLRPAGAVNRKPTHYGLPPGDVEVVFWPESRTAPQELAQRLGVDLDGTPKSQRATKEKANRRPQTDGSPDEPLDFDIPKAVADELAIATEDRSADTFRILGACKDSGLTMEQARAVVRSVGRLRERLDDRGDDDVATSWARLNDNKSWQAKAKAKAEEAKAGPPVDGAQVLDRVARWFRRFICFTFDADADLVTLWCAHTHLARELRISPRLHIDSITYGSGKTTLLEHLKALCINGLLTVGTSPAVIPRLVSMRMTTVLFDEVDRVLAPGKEGVSDLISIINSGHRYGNVRTILVPGPGGEWTPQELSTFSAVAMAGNSPQLPDDTLSRALRVLLMPDNNGEAEDTDWPMIEEECGQLAADLAAWADSVRDKVSISGVAVPGARGRELERWRTVKAVAYAAGGRWEGVADRLIEHGLAEAQALKEAGITRVPPKVQLLHDLHATWEGQPEFMATVDLCQRLIAENPAYWAENATRSDLTAVRMGKMLADATKQLAAQEKSQRPDHGGSRGYCRSQFNPTWVRLGLPMYPVHPVHPAHPAEEPEPGGPAGPGEPGTSGEGEEIPEANNSGADRTSCPGCSESIPADLESHWVCGWSR